VVRGGRADRKGGSREEGKGGGGQKMTKRKNGKRKREMK